MIKIIQMGVVIMAVILTGCSSKEKSKYTKGVIVQTSETGDKLAVKDTIELSDNNTPGTAVIQINPEQKFQQIIGFGGSFTGSSAYVLSQLNNEKRDEVIRAYFSSAGANYSLMRSQIGGSDFSVNSYAYDNTPGDKDLNDFSIKEDMDCLI
ncbi:MAG: glycosyl hydrolase family 30, partial [Ignavibacteriaceae bacterium]